MYRKLLVAGVAATALLLGLAQSGEARGHKTECNKAYSNTTLHGGVVVKSGDVCSLNNVRVTGGLTITGGQFSVQNSSIHGQWLITGGTAEGFGDECGNNVYGGIRVLNTQGGSFIFGETDRGCAGGRVDGGVRFVNNTHIGILEIDGYQIHGRVVDTNNQGQWNEIEGNTVHGSALCANNNSANGGGVINDEGGPNSYTGKDSGCPTSGGTVEGGGQGGQPGNGHGHGHGNGNGNGHGKHG